MNTLLAIGLGYTAKEIAARLKSDRSPPPHPAQRAAPGEGAKHWRIIGTSRDAKGVAEIEALGYEALQYAGDAPSADISRTISQATHILHSAPPSAAGDPLLIHHQADLASAPKLELIGYLSTIGVYGDTGGAWVDETATPNPGSERSRQRWTAEQSWMDFAARRPDMTLQIFRLAGIYGPGRNALERLRQGREKRIDKPGQVFNRIHRDDIAATVIAGIHMGAKASGVINVTDDEPAPPQDVVAFAAALLGIEPPPLIPWEDAEKTMTPMARSFWLETKRVRNERIRRELGVALSYPTYREGLRAIAEGLGCLESSIGDL